MIQNNDYIHYRRFVIRVIPEYLSTEERLARNEWRAIVKSWRYLARYNKAGFEGFEAEGFQSKEQALEDAENRIDAILDSL